MGSKIFFNLVHDNLDSNNLDEVGDDEDDIPDKAITVSHFRIGVSSVSSLCNFKKLFVEKFRWMGFDEFLYGFMLLLLLRWTDPPPPAWAEFEPAPNSEDCTRFLRLGTLGISDIEVLVSHKTTCWLPDNASVLVS